MRDLRKFQGHDASALLHVATAASTCQKFSLMQECCVKVCVCVVLAVKTLRMTSPLDCRESMAQFFNFPVIESHDWEWVAQIDIIQQIRHYCWWKKSCTSWSGEYPIFHRVSKITGGAGFLPSTVVMRNLKMRPALLLQSPFSQKKKRFLQFPYAFSTSYWAFFHWAMIMGRLFGRFRCLQCKFWNSLEFVDPPSTIWETKQEKFQA